MDSNVTSKDSLFSSEKKKDTSTIKGKKRMQKNIVQRLYYQKNLTILNSKKRASCYYNIKLAQEHKCKEMNTEKETSFRDGKETNE